MFNSVLISCTTKKLMRIIVALVAVLAMVSGSPQFPFGFNNGFGGFSEGGVGGLSRTVGNSCVNGVCSGRVCVNGMCNDYGNELSGINGINGAFMQPNINGEHFFNRNSFSRQPFTSNGMNGLNRRVSKTCVDGVCTERVCINGMCNDGFEGNGVGVRNEEIGGFEGQVMNGAGNFFNGNSFDRNPFASTGNGVNRRVSKTCVDGVCTERVCINGMCNDGFEGNGVGVRNEEIGGFERQDMNGAGNFFNGNSFHRNPFASTAEPRMCRPSLTIVNNTHPCSDTIIFEDDFNFIDETKWSKLREFGGEPDNEFVVYIPNEDVLYTQGGFLHIQPKRLATEYGENAELRSLDLGVQCTSEDGRSSDYCTRTSGSTILPPVISSRITTLNKFSFLYGRVEIRARLPSEDWVFPLLLLEPANNFYGKRNLASGQIRIAFVKGRDGLLSGGVLLGASEPTRTINMCTNPNPIDLSSDFHTFSLDWKPDGITISVSNQIYCRIDPQQGFYSYFLSNGKIVNNFASLWRNEGKMAPFDKAFRLTIGVGVGGLNDFIDYGDSVQLTPRKPWKNTQVKAMKFFWDTMKTRTDYPGRKSKLEIDYVRVYSL